MRQSEIKIIGLTGGIATGKTTVSRIIREKGYPLIDADLVAREVVEVNEPAYREIVNIFGTSILLSNNNIDREKLGSIIFDNKNLRSKLNNIVHPRIYLKVKEYIEKYKKKGSKLIFVDIPLLIEVKNDLEKENIRFDEIWLVYANKNQQIERLKERNNYTNEEAVSRINSQMDIEEKKKYCDRIIDNTKNIKYTIESIEKNISEIIME
ncbi:dephospho-CoA kinase [Clostridium sp. D2Q-14]|uniref:dephospho-CoA kinase n=1 Tax=Anaeromonas gelatinilytica TaxID=2683194 RepID=UPI00193BE522|nr:dephospho-CoA kinase [Anaeromonas gelatinilytica]MBS4535933.1 dephospho-CoA kinase [Anaeromonas gelatinilytica]